MIRFLQRFIVPLIGLAVAAHPAKAQDPLLSSVIKQAEDETPPPPEAEETPRGIERPALVFRQFFEQMNQYSDTKETGALQRAGELFDLSDVLKGDQEYIGNQAARDLLNFMDRALLPYNEDLVKNPSDDATEFTHHVAYRADGRIQSAAIHFTRMSGGGWLFSSSTRREVGDLYQQVRSIPPRHGRGGVTDATTWFRDHMPQSLHKRLVLLDHWQWIGLLALVILGVLASLLARLLTTMIRSRILSRRGVATETSGWRRSRPFGLMAMAAVWFLGLPYLTLPEFSFFALMLVVRVTLMVGTTWAICSLIDYGAEFFGARAAETRTKVDDVVVPMLQRVFKIFIVVMGIIWIADNLNIEVKALLAGLGIGGVALALAAKDTVENFFGAISILADRPFEVGDWIVIDDIEGTVETVGFRSTRIRTFYNSLITVPNALLTRATVDNLGARRYRRIKETLGVTYNTSPDRLEAFCEGIRELIRRHPYTRKDYYHVYFVGYGDSSLQVLLYLFLETPDWATELREKHRFFLDIYRLARELGVDFAFPTRTLHMIDSTTASAIAVSPETPSVANAKRDGRKRAREIVKQFTGDKIPPPVRMASDARDDASGDAGDGDG